MDLHYQINGEGHPIVLLHSGGTDLRDWTFLAPLLAKDYKVVTFDVRGIGKSPSPIEKANYVEDLLLLIDHLELETATLVGHSIGGQIATEFALNYPEKVKNLILIAPSLSGFNYSQAFNEYINSINQVAPDIDQMLDVSLSGSLYQVVMSSPHRDIMIQMHRDYFHRVLTWPKFEIIWPQPPAIERLDELSMNTLFIIGEKDFQDNHRVAEHFNKVPNVRFFEIANADHMVTLTHPDELFAKIDNFMKE
ncbi:alpha/beta fold hydrolase [Gracilibacillus sp. D59]|uniref:alpha/beta fold hydrolase n=1 Tax=Gracilibacillus sp. D59 TaxID=3457434 RepID=UPI003FCC4885